jgi:hypothetical protein
MDENKKLRAGDGDFALMVHSSEHIQTEFCVLVGKNAGAPWVRRDELVSKILEAEGDGEVVGANCANGALKVVFAFARDADLVAHDLGGDFEFEIADEACDLFCDRGIDALFDEKDLPGVSQRGDIGIFSVDAFEADLAFGEFVQDDFVEGFEVKLVFGGQFNFVFLENDFRWRVFEVETGGEFLPGLIDGVFQLHGVDLRDDVKGRHGARITG